jgi:hypothetical protein
VHAQHASGAVESNKVGTSDQYATGRAAAEYADAVNQRTYLWTPVIGVKIREGPTTRRLFDATVGPHVSLINISQSSTLTVFFRMKNDAVVVSRKTRFSFDWCNQIFAAIAMMLCLVMELIDIYISLRVCPAAMGDVDATSSSQVACRRKVHRYHSL